MYACQRTRANTINTVVYFAAITPHSWRTGQKLVQKQLGPFHSNSGEYFNDVLTRVNSFVSYKISTRRVQYI